MSLIASTSFISAATEKSGMPLNAERPVSHCDFPSHMPVLLFKSVAKLLVGRRTYPCRCSASPRL